MTRTARKPRPVKARAPRFFSRHKRSIIRGIVYGSLSLGVTALVVGTAATVTSVLLPALAAFVEATAIARLAAAVAAFGHPEFGAAMQHSPLLAATVVVGGALVIRRLTAHPAAREWSVIAFLPSRHIAA